MSHRGRGTSSNRGRGGRTIAQFGNQRLIAENITSSSSSNSLNDDILYKKFLEIKAQQGNTLHKEFMEFKAKQGNTTSPSYANIAGEDDSDDMLYEENTHKELILLLEEKDLKWKDEIWHLMQRYLDNASFTAGSYKQRIHFENILKTTGSCEFSHFYAGKQTKAYSFSKVIIKQIISAEGWGISTLKEREYFLPDQKIQVKFNYWDYIEAFNKAFLYQNPAKKHSWFFKVCPNVYNKDIPNWLYQWWLKYGPSEKILPEPYKGLFNEWVKISPPLIEAEHNNAWIEGMPSLHFFLEFGIPWIWKWEPEVGYTQQNIPCLRRIFLTKFWKKMLRNNEHGVLEGQDTIDMINDHINCYQEQINIGQQREFPSPFQHISRRLNLQKDHMTKEEIIGKFTSYMEEVKTDIFKNLGVDITSDDISMIGSSYKEDGEEDILPGESQDPNAEVADVDKLLEKMNDDLTEQIQGSQKKNKKKKNKDN